MAKRIDIGRGFAAVMNHPEPGSIVFRMAHAECSAFYLAVLRRRVMFRQTGLWVNLPPFSLTATERPYRGGKGGGVSTRLHFPLYALPRASNFRPQWHMLCLVLFEAYHSVTKAPVRRTNRRSHRYLCYSGYLRRLANARRSRLKCAG